MHIFSPHGFVGSLCYGVFSGLALSAPVNTVGAAKGRAAHQRGVSTPTLFQTLAENRCAGLPSERLSACGVEKRVRGNVVLAIQIIKGRKTILAIDPPADLLISGDAQVAASAAKS